MHHCPSILLFFFPTVVVHRCNPSRLCCFTFCIILPQFELVVGKSSEMKFQNDASFSNNSSLVFDFGSYEAKQEMCDSLSLIFEFQLCSSEELQQGSRIDLSSFSRSVVVQRGSGIHKKTTIGKVPSNIDIEKILQLI